VTHQLPKLCTMTIHLLAFQTAAQAHLPLNLSPLPQVQGSPARSAHRQSPSHLPPNQGPAPISPTPALLMTSLYKFPLHRMFPAELQFLFTPTPGEAGRPTTYHPDLIPHKREVAVSADLQASSTTMTSTQLNSPPTFHFQATLKLPLPTQAGA
jgi:hypothetical protein